MRTYLTTEREFILETAHTATTEEALMAIQAQVQPVGGMDHTVHIPKHEQGLKHREALPRLLLLPTTAPPRLTEAALR